MLTFPDVDLVRDDRPAYRPYRAAVARIVDLSPSFRRVTFTGPDLATFGSDGLDQRVKIVFPIEGRAMCDAGWDDPDCIAAGDWYSRWRALPVDERNPFRTYTVRGIRAIEREVDVDFVVHGDGGPAARWIATASVGDELILVGPDAQSLSSHVGIDWRPGPATDVLLAGDATAAPGICSILESLPESVRATAFIEVPSADDVLAVSHGANVRVEWLPRSGAESGLVGAVAGWAREHTSAMQIVSAPQELEEIDVDVEMLWDSPDADSGSFYAWFAGESAIIKALRRTLVRDFGVDRSRVAFMGYWREGKSEAQE
jgi:NADPH-dependent ferric siderophore reductase